MTQHIHWIVFVLLVDGVKWQQEWTDLNKWEDMEAQREDREQHETRHWITKKEKGQTWVMTLKHKENRKTMMWQHMEAVRK